MSHTTIYFITEAENIDQAENRVTGYLDSENFFDYFSVLPDESGPLEKKRKELTEFLNGWDWKKSADDFLSLAEKSKASGNFDQYGYNLIAAGQLYAQYLTADTYVFNIDTGDYSIPADDTGRWVIAVDFHY